MKKVYVLGVAMVLSLVLAQEGHCWTFGKKKQEASSSQAAPAAQAPSAQAGPVIAAGAGAAAGRVAPPEAKPQKPAKKDDSKNIIEKKKGEINNNQWDVTVMAMSGKGVKQQDVLVFRDNKFSSEYFAKSGFGASNYTLSVQELGVIVFETMQTSEKEGTIFWRGEFDANLASCKGVLSRQLPGNKTEDFSFLSTGKKPVLNNPAPAQGQ